MWKTTPPPTTVKTQHNTTQHIADAANKQQKTRFSALSPHISIIQ